MSIERVSELDLKIDLERARSVANASFKRGNVNYSWVETHSGEPIDRVRERCQSLHAGGRAVMLVSHSNGNLTIWQGPADSAFTLSYGMSEEVGTSPN